MRCIVSWEVEYWYNFIYFWPVEFNSGCLHEYDHHLRKWFCLPLQPWNSVSCSGRCDGSHEQPPTVMECWQVADSYADNVSSACSWVPWPCPQNSVSQNFPHSLSGSHVHSSPSSTKFPEPRRKWYGCPAQGWAENSHLLSTLSK